MSATPDYADLEIRIFKETDDGYPIELTLNDEQEFKRGYLKPEIPLWLDDESPADYGEKLFDWFFEDDDIKEAWDKVSGQYPQRRLRLRIDAEAPKLNSVPWEQMRDPNTHLDLAAIEATPFSRYLSGRWHPGAHVLRRPIRVLVAMANPIDLKEKYDLEAIEIDEEWRNLQDATEDQDVELVQMPQPCSLLALQSELKHGYHVLHFIGHGMFSERRGEARLYMANEANQVDLVGESELAGILGRQLADMNVEREDKLRLVFLASCQTATQSSTDSFRGLAPALVNAGVPAVVAMQDLVPVETARQFTSVFYHQLLEHGLVDLAGNEARSAVIAANLSDAVVPVIFSRLRNGRLLGQRGRISSDDAENFWPFLLEKIDSGLCIPFLGPRVNDGLLPSPQRISEKLADRYNYPLEDRQDLVRVAEFMSISDSSTLRRDYVRFLKNSLFSYLGLKPTEEDRQKLRNASFTDTVTYLNWSERIVEQQENEVHHLLAALPFPLYMTTEFDSFMTAALDARLAANAQQTNPTRRLGLRWQAEAGSPQWVLEPPPSRDNPAVIHLNGHDGEVDQLQNVVLSVDDYLSQFVRLSRDQDHILPSNVLGMLANSSYLFLGYDIDDWAFRSVLQGLIGGIAQLPSTGKKLNVGVQISIDQTHIADEIETYLKRYLSHYNIDIYWGTTQQFVSELSDRWRKYDEEEDDDFDL